MSDIFEKLNHRIGGAQINYHFNFSLKNKYLFVQNSKAGCTYLKTALSCVELNDPIYFSNRYIYTNQKNILNDAIYPTPHQFINKSVFVKPYQLGIENFNNIITDGSFFKFCVVRNPFSRILSAYLDTIKKERLPAASLMKYFEDILAKKNGEFKISEISFYEFLKSLELQVNAEGWGVVNQHYRLQSFHLSDDIIHYDKIYKLEDFDAALIDISNNLKKQIPKVIQKGHKTDAADKLGVFFDNEKTIDIVKKLFESDLDQFKYTAPIVR